MLQKLSLKVAGHEDGLRLDRFLASAVPERTGVELSRRSARRRIADGAVWVDGHRTKVASRALRPGQRVEVWIDPAVQGPTGREPVAAALPELDVEARSLYEDEHLLAIDKPSGIAVQATVDDDRHHLLARVRGFFERQRAGARPELALPHRLDRGTSGVQLVVKTRAANARLSEAFRERRIGKKYLALCAAEEPPPERWTVADRLELRSEGPGRPRRAVVVAEGGRNARGRPAETSFEVRERFPGAVLVEAEPKTGRTHQVRVHLAKTGLPVLGDRLYGPPLSPIRAPRLMLHAAELRFDHPATGEGLVIESPLPDDFRRLIEDLRSADTTRR